MRNMLLSLIILLGLGSSLFATSASLDTSCPPAIKVKKAFQTILGTADVNTMLLEELRKELSIPQDITGSVNLGNLTVPELRLIPPTNPKGPVAICIYKDASDKQIMQLLLLKGQ